MTNGRHEQSDTMLERALQDTLRAFQLDKMGLSFEALVQFTAPLLDYYDLDVADRLNADPAELDTDTLQEVVSLLDAARLLWAYFSLDDGARTHHRPRLEAELIGPNATSGELALLPALLRRMEAHWNTMEAMRPAAPALAAAVFPSRNGVDTSADPTARQDDAFGPEALTPPEAFALFAGPILEDPDVLCDPDALEEATARAEAYWDLAQEPVASQDQHLAALAQRLASSPHEVSRITSEARSMLQRYHTLFLGRR